MFGNDYYQFKREPAIEYDDLVADGTIPKPVSCDNCHAGEQYAKVFSDSNNRIVVKCTFCGKTGHKVKVKGPVSTMSRDRIVDAATKAVKYWNGEL